MKIFSNAKWDIIQTKHQMDLNKKDIEISNKKIEICTLKERLCYLDLIERIYGIFFEGKTMEEAAEMFEKRSEFWPRFHEQYHQGMIDGSEVILNAFIKRGIITEKYADELRKAVLQAIEDAKKKVEENNEREQIT